MPGMASPLPCRHGRRERAARSAAKSKQKMPEMCWGARPPAPPPGASSPLSTASLGEGGRGAPLPLLPPPPLTSQAPCTIMVPPLWSCCSCRTLNCPPLPSHLSSPAARAALAPIRRCGRAAPAVPAAPPARQCPAQRRWRLPAMLPSGPVLPPKRRGRCRGSSGRRPCPGAGCGRVHSGGAGCSGRSGGGVARDGGGPVAHRNRDRVPCAPRLYYMLVEVVNGNLWKRSRIEGGVDWKSGRQRAGTAGRVLRYDGRVAGRMLSGCPASVRFPGSSRGFAWQGWKAVGEVSADEGIESGSPCFSTM